MKHQELFTCDHEFRKRGGNVDLRIKITRVLKKHTFDCPDTHILLDSCGERAHVEVYAAGSAADLLDLHALAPGVAFILRNVSDDEDVLQEVLEFFASCCTVEKSSVASKPASSADDEVLAILRDFATQIGSASEKPPIGPRIFNTAVSLFSAGFLVAAYASNVVEGLALGITAFVVLERLK